MTDPRLHNLLPHARGRLRGVIAVALGQTVSQLGAKADASPSNSQRQLMLTADRELRLKASKVLALFERELQTLTENCLTASALHKPDGLRNTDWAALSLVDHDQVERDVMADRLALALTGHCHAAFDTLSGYVSALMDDAAPDRNPLRPKLIAKALLDSMSQTGMPEDTLRTIAALLPQVLGPQLSECYQLITTDMRNMGAQALGMAIQKAPHLKAPATASIARNTEPAPLAPMGTQQRAAAGDSRSAQTIGDLFGLPLPKDEASDANGQHTDIATNGELRVLLKQLSRQPLEADLASHLPITDRAASPASERPLVAVNQIRAHHEELVRASGGAALDKMVIDVVAALFDQVLADPKVPPEMARQIARLQIPVLRVALGDMHFFSSRKHPVRRLVNRMASLSAAYDDYSQGAGARCLERITQLVNDIVEGDFERMDLYERKVRELEEAIETESNSEVSFSAEVTALLSMKEADLRVQQRYMQIMQRELLSVELPEFLRDFLAKVWSRVVVAAAVREGAESALVQRMKKAGRELALSVQPKGHPKMRQAFLVQLPQLMKDVHDGLQLIQAPESDKQAFFAQLLPTHAGCLKAPPPHELTQRLLEQQLRQLENIPIPSREETAGDTMPSPLDRLHCDTGMGSEPLLNADEIRQSGLLTEASLDINLDLANPAPEADPTLADLDIQLDIPAVPSAGLQLAHHIQKGTPYHMVMQGKWQKVRLTWVSEGRTFFIFTAGGMHKQTISLTGRTLAKMCETGRFKAFEQAELIERATVRARKQLAALSASAMH